MILYFVIAMSWIAVKSAIVMKKTSLIISSVCVLALAACGPGRTEQAEIDQKAAEAEKAAQAPVELPPSITSSTVYRCRGGAVLYVDYLGDNVAAQVRIDDEVAVPVSLKPTEDGGSMVSEDGTIKLTGTGGKVTAELPGKGSLVCNS